MIKIIKNDDSGLTKNRSLSWYNATIYIS